MKTLGIFDSTRQDLHYALRAYARQPAFAAAVVLTLALAIGGNTAMFTVIRGVLLKPLPYRDPARVVNISGGATPTRFREMRAGARSFAELDAYIGPENVTLSGAGEPEVLRGVRVSCDFLQALAVAPFLGRTFRSEEDAAGGAPVAMIGAGLWERRFASDPQIAGKTVTLASTAYTIIGVLPPHFQFPLPDLDIWLTAPTEEPLIPPKSRALSPYLEVFGRLKPGASIAQADAEMKVLRRQYARAHPAMLDAAARPVEVTPLRDHLVADVRSMLWMLFGAVGFVLLIACANVAGLLVARAAARGREFAIRAAVGAGRRRLIRQLLAESVLLSLAGGALGVLLAAWTLRAIPQIPALHLPRTGEIQLDWMVLAFSAALSVSAGILFGLLPSLGASRPDLIAILRAGGAAAQPAVPRRGPAALDLRASLVTGQIALSMVLLIGAALLVQSIAHLRNVDLGFNASHLLTMRIALPPLRYDTDLKREAFFEDLIRNVESLPGVRGAVAASVLPMTPQPGTPVQNAADPLRKLNERPIEAIWSLTPGFFRTFQIPLQRGRDFDPHDRSESERVVIIDDALARQFWPAYPRGLDPVGQRLIVGGIDPRPARVIGVVAGVRHNLEGNHWPGTVFDVFSHYAPQSALLAIRTAGDPLQYTGGVRAALRALDRDQAIANVETMDDLVEAEVGPRRSLMILLESFSGVALLLALIGIYGVVSFGVAQRIQEMGIRRALGAEQGDIVWLILRQGLGLVLAGIALGLGGAAALTRLVSAHLFQVSATDPATFAAIAVLFLIAALAACYLPAFRASRIDPMSALRV